MKDSDDSLQSDIRNGHIPVLLKETVRLLAPRDGQTYLDCTFGGGGHTRAILNSANCKVVAIDRDKEAVARAEKLKAEFGDRFEFHSAKFSQLDEFGNRGYAGVLFDFGVSSFQLDEGERGFSINKTAVPDMRMNNSEGESALDFINRASEFELAQVLRDYGEEQSFRKVARAIIAARDAGKISTTTDLAQAVAEAVPARGHIHPATKTFQALRIQVNDELGEIRTALPKAFDVLASGGIIAAISFHSLEDRIVKQFFKKQSGRPESRADRSFVQDRVKLATLLTTKPIVADESEISENPRSRSAKLRGLKKD